MAGYPSASEALETAEIIKSIRRGRPETALALLRQQMKHVHELPYRDCKLNLTYFTYDLLKNFNKSSVLHEISSIHHLLERYSTLSEYQAWLESIVTMLASETEVPKSSSRKGRNRPGDQRVREQPLAGCAIVDRADSRQFFLLRELYPAAVQRDHERVIVRVHTSGTNRESEGETDIQPALGAGDRRSMRLHIQRAFFAAFKKFTNLTPKQYREIHGDSAVKDIVPPGLTWRSGS